MNEKKIREFVKSLIVGKDIMVLDSVSSTNTKLAELASSEFNDGMVLLSDFQTAGRGRMGRHWFSPDGLNIYMSVLFKPDIHPHYSPVFTFIASIALVKTLRYLNFIPVIKWPNDILINRKKVSGVLTEMKSMGDKLDYIIVGIGLNVNMTKEFVEKNLPSDLDKITSLLMENGNEFDREYVASKLISYLDECYLKFLRQGVYSVVADWTNEWGKLNEFVSIDVSGKIISGVVRKVDSHGYIYIEKTNGSLEKIIAGDMVFSSQN